MGRGGAPGAGPGCPPAPTAFFSPGRPIDRSMTTVSTSGGVEPSGIAPRSPAGRAVCDTPMDALRGRAAATRPRGRGGPGGLGSGRRGNRRCSETGILPATITAHPPVSHKVFHRRGRPAAKAPESGSRFFFFFRAIACVRIISAKGARGRGVTPSPSPGRPSRPTAFFSLAGHFDRSHGMGGGTKPGLDYESIWHTCMARRRTDFKQESWQTATDAICQPKCDGAPNGTRTRVPALKGRCPRPLDDGDVSARLPSIAASSRPAVAGRATDGAPNGTRTRVPALKGRCPRPLDDGDVSARLPSIAASSRPAVAGRATSPGRWTGRRPRRRRARQAARRPS